MFHRLIGLCNTNARHLAMVARRFSSEPDPRFIILNPREAGIVKRPKRRTYNKIEFSGELQPPPLEPQLPQQVSVVTEIHSRRPESQAITLQRYTQLRDELFRGFKKQQLSEYLASQGISFAKSAKKQKIVNLILNNAWNCVVRRDGEGALVENSLELSERDFVLLLGGKGRLLREWSKSGARISLLPERCQIQVQSREQTFNWISATLSKFLESVIATEVDISEFKKLMNPLANPDLITAVQQLTDTYFGNKDLDAESIIVYSAGQQKHVNIALVKRLLLHLADPVVSQKWRPSTWNYDANSTNHASYFLHPFEDIDSMEWTERLNNWMRWEVIKRKNSAADLDTIDLKELESPHFAETSTESSETPLAMDKSPEETQITNDSVKNQVMQITRNLFKTYPAPMSPDGVPVSTTLTVTPGFILHNSGGDTTLPNAGMMKMFNSNIPYVSTLASTLPLYSKDIHQENTLDTQAPEQRDLWMDILNMGPDRPLNEPIDDSRKRVFTSRRKDMQLAPNLRVIQLKFMANPSEGHALEYPPIVAWAILPSLSNTGGTRLTEVPRVDAVPLEASAHISLPNNKSDLKVTLAHTYPIKITEDIEEFFMQKCLFGWSGPVRIPPEMKVEMNGNQVSYLYHSSAYVTLAELELNNSLLHLSQVEGGKLGGRKIEASLVLHAESKDFSMAEAESTVYNAVNFVKKL